MRLKLVKKIKVKISHKKLAVIKHSHKTINMEYKYLERSEAVDDWLV